ncbi:MAG: TetR/AcrR family transcriptional regulator [Microlunatus sp.]|nr:TetR/AcrR family transcriptional regulator [Microlunatus sp.]MDN5770253.1 TetR/AcrR family transcriptional regulator [Microlunatus sp.]MDN5803048.1 TetR/AcrR family transcriptional regulator [Microlunatus sp.]
MARANPLPPDERRAAILTASEPLVMQYGREVSTRQIAEAAGIAEGTIFRVFPNKDAVIDAVIGDAFDAETTFAALTGIDSELDLTTRLELAVEVLEARMRRVVSLFGALRTDPQTVTDAGRSEHERRRERHEEQRRAGNARLTAALVQVIGPDAERLKLPADKAADLIRGLVFTVTHPGIGVTISDEPREIVDTLLHGILTPTHAGLSPC